MIQINSCESFPIQIDSSKDGNIGLSKHTISIQSLFRLHCTKLPETVMLRRKIIEMRKKELLIVRITEKIWNLIYPIVNFRL